MKAFSRHIMLSVWIACAIAFNFTAQAQSFFNTTSGDLNDSTFCAGGKNANGNGVVNDLERTFSVSGLSTITALNLGFISTHTWRGDLDIRLESPLGTEVQLVVPDTFGSGNLDDYNIEFGDSFTKTVNTGSHAVANDVTAPAYEFPVSPDNPLANFNGESPNGTWTLKICDDYTGESGTFISSELIFRPTTGADLSLSVSADN